MARRTAEQMLAEARTRIEPRLTPVETLAALREGAIVIDLRSTDVRRRDGIIPASIHVPRSVLEWRADPDSRWRNPLLSDLDRRVILVCEHGFSSSLAASNLRELGFAHATDLIGGFAAWRDDGLPVAAAPEPTAGRPGMGGPDI